MSGAQPFPTSAFADEADPALEHQLDALVANQIAGLDVRSVGGVNVLNLTADELKNVRTHCEARGLHVETVGSPVNKVDMMPENRADEMAKLRKAIAACGVLGAEKIRIFSPEVPEAALAEAWPAVKAWMGEMAALARDEGVMLLHENDARFYGAYPEGAKRLVEAFSGPAFRFAFDFSNTVLIGYRPMKDWFPWLLPHLDTLHIKDSIEADHKVVPAGEGDGQMVETLRWLIEQGWHGTLTLEPHLQAAGPLGGFSGPELFGVAAKAMRKVVAEAGGEC